MLKKLYCDTDGPNWKNSTEWGSNNLGSWHGVTTDQGGGRVTFLKLSFNTLSGKIPTELGMLSNLEELWLNNNQLNGEIPTELETLSSLTWLYLSQNQLSGSIPTELGILSNLERLWLDNNELSGEIPTELGTLSSLTRLTLNNNQLSGEIPIELGMLSNLTRLFLNNNQLSGEIPSELGMLSNLEELWLSDNRLSGEIPSELGMLSNLTQFRLERNQLTGSIPDLSGLNKVVFLYLQSNQLTRSIPSELGMLTSLQRLYLQSNQLTGSIPSELGSLSDLRRLWLHVNQLSGEIPTELGNLSSLTHLFLYNNQLSGEILTELGDLNGLRLLYLHKNGLSGSIPTELGNLTNLVEISFWSNPELMIFPLNVGLVSLLPKHDKAALRFIYVRNNGEQWRNRDNWLSEEPLGDWRGVTVNDNGWVTGLDRRFNNLSGPMDGAFSGLLSLEILILLENRSLTGELPLGLMDLPDLRAVILQCTGVGVPDDDAFKAWLASISFTSSYCPPPTPPPPPPPPPPSTTPATPPPLPDSDCIGLQESKEDGLAVCSGCVGTSLVTFPEGEYITIELRIAGDQELGEVPSVILPSSLLERVETVSFNLSVLPEEELPEALSLEGFVADVGIGDIMLEEDETVTVCLPAYSFEDGEESMPKLYRYKEEWNPLSGLRIETVKDIESVCADVSSFPSRFGVFAEIPEPPVMEEGSGGGCSVSGEVGRNDQFNVVLNLLLIIFSLLGVSLKRQNLHSKKTVVRGGF